KWLQSQPAIYQSESEKKIEDMKALLQKEQDSSSVQSALGQLDQQVKQHKIAEVESHKKEIISMLNAEIVTRYYYRRGAIENRIAKDDEAISKALEVLENTKKYADILK